jgi:HK97 family phage prohead protease
MGEQQQVNASEYEVRAFPVQLRAETKEGKSRIVGLAAPFNIETEIGGWFPFREVIRPGSFKETIVNGPDQIALMEHDRRLLLGRKSAGTLALKETDEGLEVEIEPPDTQVGRDAVTSISRGDLKGMSIAFWVLNETEGMKDGEFFREITKVDLDEVSITARPAYEDTRVSVSFRSRLDQYSNGNGNGKRCWRLSSARAALAIRELEVVG